VKGADNAIEANAFPEESRGALLRFDLGIATRQARSVLCRPLIMHTSAARRDNIPIRQPAKFASLICVESGTVIKARDDGMEACFHAFNPRYATRD